MELVLGLAAVGVATLLFIAANVVALELMIGGRHDQATRKPHR